MRTFREHFEQFPHELLLSKTRRAITDAGYGQTFKSNPNVFHHRGREDDDEATLEHGPGHEKLRDDLTRLGWQKEPTVSYGSYENEDEDEPSGPDIERRTSWSHPSGHYMRHFSDYSYAPAGYHEFKIFHPSDKKHALTESENLYASMPPRLLRAKTRQALATHGEPNRSFHHDGRRTNEYYYDNDKKDEIYKSLRNLGWKPLIKNLALSHPADPHSHITTFGGVAHYDHVEEPFLVERRQRDSNTNP